MAESLILTVDVVKALVPPPKGERWIADSVVRGFGVRVWATKGGGNLAFAIRVPDRSGVVRRETYASRNSPCFRLMRLVNCEYVYADCLDDAREWARERIKEIKGLPTKQDLQKQRRLARERRVLGMTLAELVAEKIAKMRKKRRSEAYTDRLDKLFNRIIPADMRATRMSELQAGPIIESIIASGDKPGTVSVFRSFMSGVLEDAANACFALRSVHQAYTDEFWNKWESTAEVPYPELGSFPERVYEDLFSRLRREDEFWQQALCIRLYFEVSVPLSRLMSAERRQISEGKFFPYLLGEEKYRFWKFHRLTADVAEILEASFKRGDAEFPETPYLFPSRFGRKCQHIRTVDGMWRTALYDLGIRFYPLRQFVESYRGPTSPNRRLGASRTPSYGRDLRPEDGFAVSTLRWSDHP